MSNSKKDEDCIIAIISDSNVYFHLRPKSLSADSLTTLYHHIFSVNVGCVDYFVNIKYKESLPVFRQPAKKRSLFFIVCNLFVSVLI